MNSAQQDGLNLDLTTARVFQPLIGSTKRFQGISGGRGSGKSHFVGEETVLDCLDNHVRMVCAREVQNSIKDSSKQLIEDKINKHGLTKAFRITDREIIYEPTDSLIIFRGLQNHTAASIKSLEGFNRLWVEEAQTISARSLELAIPTFRSGSQLKFTWNPDKATDPVDKLFLENANDPDFIHIRANYYDNPWFPPELYRDMLRDKKRDPDKYAHTWLGQYKLNSEARVFKNYQALEFCTPKFARFYFGVDWGFANDPSVALRCFIGILRNGVPVADPDGDCLFVDYAVGKTQLEIQNTPAFFGGNDVVLPSRYKNPNKYEGIPEIRDWPCTADSSRPETISHMQQNGFPRMQASLKGAGSVEDGVEFLRGYDVYIHPRAKEVLEEFNNYSYKIDKKTNEILPILVDANNHYIDALRYALEATRRSQYTLDNL